MPVITIVFGNRRRLIGLPDSYDLLMRKVRSVFDLDDADFLVHFTPSFATEEVELDPTAYDAVSDKCVLRVEQIFSKEPECAESKRKRTQIGTLRPDPPINMVIRILIIPWTEDPSSFELHIPSSTTILELEIMISKKTKIPLGDLRLRFEGDRLDSRYSLGHNVNGVENGSTIEVFLGLKGGKPAIYLLSPIPLDSVSVQVTLSHHWKFTTLWPLKEPSVTDQTSRVDWNVSARPDGTLKSLGSDVECSYLFWEAEAEANTNASDIKLSPSDAYPFNPQRPQLNRTGVDALILSFDDFMPYLYWVLESLTLTTAMRTEFIVYWLPKFQKIRDTGLDIVFDFVPQADFEKVAKLNVTPKPQTVARVFLLFDGVTKQSHERKKTLDQMKDIDWPARIGIDMERMKDGCAFRVLEWGGMEAHI